MRGFPPHACIAVAVAMGMCAGCQQAPDATVPEVPSSHLAAFEARIAKLETDAAFSESLRAGAERRIRSLETETRRFKKVSFDPGAERASQRLDSDIGPLLLALEDIQPFADGSRVEIHVGNLASAAISGATLKIAWNRKAPADIADGASQEEVEKYSKAFGDWLDAEKEKDVNLLETLQPGVWTVVTANLPGVAPKELGYVEGRMTVQQVRMGLRKR